ncbi:peptide/nickel transport system permease protein [Symbiobacterium terraclitae]|uniref:Peptide/nickel transport system permease protein n=1 Tax=Symbiobacterium terraclitae TaxID=557451 RepID=A0ABS4JPR9_9FIRM|nr:ABC transporter permease [Symbiobacterium terraclitae]MBP2017510.1 peptide/nickel transport system permease protein [Symbiobacterium terraclitae]
MKKLVVSLVTILFAIICMFLVIQNMPGDPVETLAAEIARTENLEMELAYAKAKSVLNYDPDIPVMQRLVNYLGGVLRGNLGTSLAYHKPVLQLVLGALPWTLLVLTISLTLSFSVGVLTGIFIAWKRKRWMNAALNVWQSIFGSIPDYIVAYLLIFLFAVTLGWLPARGPYSAEVTPGFNMAFIANVIRHAILPVMAYFLTTVANWTIGMRANALTVLGEDYVTYATARGLSQRRILVHYVGRNSVLPMITSLAISFGFMFGGSPLIENLFLYPGVGYYLNQAITRRDYPLMQGMYFIMIVVVVLSGLLAEKLYAVLNPRLRER